MSIEQLQSWQDSLYSWQISSTSQRIGTIIVGEVHFNDGLQKRQLELIERVKPAVVLHELLSGAVLYDPARKLLLQQPGRQLADADKQDYKNWRRKRQTSYWSKFFDQADRLGHYLMGCDLTVGEAVQSWKHDTKAAKADGYGTSFLNWTERTRSQGLRENAWPRFSIPTSTGGCYWLCSQRDRKMAECLQTIELANAGIILCIAGSNHVCCMYNHGLLNALRKKYLIALPIAYREGKSIPGYWAQRLSL